eukprot:scaffold205098_cov40-Attheya_sp.AAC.1
MAGLQIRKPSNPNHILSRSNLFLEVTSLQPNAELWTLCEATCAGDHVQPGSWRRKLLWARMLRRRRLTPRESLEGGCAPTGSTGPPLESARIGYRDMGARWDPA